CALPLRGSATSRKIVIKEGIGKLQEGAIQRIQITSQRQPYFSNAIPLGCGGSSYCLLPLWGVDRAALVRVTSARLRDAGFSLRMRYRNAAPRVRPIGQCI